MHQVIEFYEQNLRLSRETADQRGEMAALNSLGRAYAALDDRDKAVECYEQVLRIARQIGNLRGERQTLKNLDEILKLSDVPLDPNDKTSGEKSPSQKLGKKSSPAKAKSTWNKPTRQRKPKPPRVRKKPSEK